MWGTERRHLQSLCLELDTARGPAQGSRRLATSCSRDLKRIFSTPSCNELRSTDLLKACVLWRTAATQYWLQCARAQDLSASQSLSSCLLNS